MQKHNPYLYFSKPDFVLSLKKEKLRAVVLNLPNIVIL